MLAKYYYKHQDDTLSKDQAYIDKMLAKYYY